MRHRLPRISAESGLLTRSGERHSSYPHQHLHYITLDKLFFSPSSVLRIMSDEQSWDPSYSYAHYQETPTTTAGNTSELSVSPWDMRVVKQYSQPQLQPAYASNMTGNSSYSGSVPGQFLQLPPSDSRPTMSTPSPGVSYDQQPIHWPYSTQSSALIHIPQQSLSVNEAAMVPTAPQTSKPRRPKRQASLVGPTSPQRPDRCSKPSSSVVSRKASGVKGPHKSPHKERPHRLLQDSLLQWRTSPCSTGHPPKKSRSPLGRTYRLFRRLKCIKGETKNSSGSRELRPDS